MINSVEFLGGAKAEKGSAPLDIFANFIVSHIKAELSKGSEKSANELLASIDNNLFVGAIKAFEKGSSTGQDEYAVSVLNTDQKKYIDKCVSTHEGLARELPKRLPDHLKNGLMDDPLFMIEILLSERDSLNRRIETDKMYAEMHDELVSNLSELVMELEKGHYGSPVLTSARLLIDRANSTKDRAPIKERVRNVAPRILSTLEKISDSYGTVLVSYGNHMPQAERESRTKILNEALQLLAYIHEEDSKNESVDTQEPSSGMSL